MDEMERKLISRFCRAERLKTELLNLMQIFLRIQDSIKYKNEKPDGQTLLTWILNLLNNEITQAASISQSKNLIQAQNFIADVITKYDKSGDIPEFEAIIDLMRNAVTKITSEAAEVAGALKF
ncbi:MAG: hypothetical protein ACTSRS_03620 [Candidatus Helarchaeota archaeon]